MKKMISFSLAVLMFFPTMSVFADTPEFVPPDYPYSLNYMVAGDFDNNFKTVGTSWTSAPIIVPYSVSSMYDSYTVMKTETNNSVYIKADGYGGSYGKDENFHYISLVSAVEAYFGIDMAQFVLDNFKWQDFGVSGKTRETIGDCTFGFTKGNNHSGYDITIKRTPIFIDLDIEWADSAIMNMLGNGIISGIGDNKFAPNNDTTRAMAWTVLARFSDVDTNNGDNWWDIGKSWAVSSGVSDGENAENSITREEFATMIYRFMQYSKTDTNGGFTSVVFDDKNAISTWAVEATQALQSCGIIHGYYDNGWQFNPKGKITRAEMCVMLNNLYEYQKNTIAK